MGKSRVAQICIKDYYSVEHDDEDRTYTQTQQEKWVGFSE